MLSASHISVAQYNIFLLWKTLLYILFKKLSDIAVPLLWNRKVKMCSVQWCNYSQYYEETWSLSFVSNRDARPVALFVCPGLVCLRQDRAEHFTKQCHSAPLTRHAQDHLDFSPSPFCFCSGSYEKKYTRKWLRGHCPKIVKDPTVIRGHPGCSGSPPPGSQTCSISSLVLTAPRSVEHYSHTGNQRIFFCGFS